MAEVFTLTTPIVVNVTTWKVNELHLSRKHSSIFVEVERSDGVTIQWTYWGTVALTLINALNKANLTVKSLEKRILEQLAADGIITAGAVTGTPD